MISITDPSALTPGDVYKQARLVAAKTSRGSDRNWYKDPLDLPYQWHLWFDGGMLVASATFSRSDHAWREGPDIQLSNLTTAEGVGDILGELLTANYFSHKPACLGVILHVADEFALAGLAQPQDGGGGEVSDDLELIKFNLIDDPRESLADREVSMETTSWRLLPFWGAPAGQAKGTAIALSRSRESFLQELLKHGEELRVPIRVAVTAAPVEHLAALPLIEPAITGGRLVVLPYLKFTAVFAISHNGELRSARSLAHRGGARVPTGLSDILASMAVSAELAGVGPVVAMPKVLVASADQETLMAAVRPIQSASVNGMPVEVHALDLSTHAAVANLPGRRPEFMVYDNKLVAAARHSDAPLAKTQTFAALWKDWLTGTNFFDTAKLDALYPTLRDLRLLRLATFVVMVLGASLLGLAGYGAFSFYKASTHPSWNLTPEQLKRTEAQQVKLQDERRQIDVAERLLTPRSRGWTTLEFLLQMFPEEAGVRLESFDYGMDAARLGPAQAKGKPPETAGLVRTWSFRGLAKQQALELLNTLNSQRGLNAMFDRVAKATGDASYTPDPMRQLTIALTQGRNARFVADPGSAKGPLDPTSAFPFTFEATITQTLTDKDVLALPTEKTF